MDSRYIDTTQCVVARNTVIEAFEKDLKIMKLVNRPFLNLRRFKQVYKRVCGLDVLSLITIFRVFRDQDDIFTVCFGLNLNVDPKIKINNVGLLRDREVEDYFQVIQDINPLECLYNYVRKFDREPIISIPVRPKIFIPGGYERTYHGGGTFQGIRDVTSEFVPQHYERGLVKGYRKIKIPKLDKWIRKQIIDRCEENHKIVLIQKAKFLYKKNMEKPKIPEFSKVPKDQLIQVINDHKQKNREYCMSLDPRQEKLLKMQAMILVVQPNTKAYRDLRNSIISLSKILGVYDENKLY